MGKRKFWSAAAVFALVASPAIAGPNLVQNGDFENNGLTDWTAHGWSTNINGVISGNYSASTGCVGSGCIRNSDGTFNTTSGAYLYQDIPTVAGSLYTLTFDFGAAGTTNELAVLFGNTTAFDQMNLPNTNTTYTINNLLATGDTTRLLFLGRQDPSYDRLDNISVVAAVAGAVPEPASWALMLLGFGAIGSALRFRHKVQLKLRSAF